MYACVRVLSEAIAQLPLHLYIYNDSGKERVPQHPLYFLLHDQPNPEMTSFVFRETLMSHLLIYGNAYAQIIRNGRGDVLGLYPLMPDKMKVDRDEKNRLIYIYSRYDEANPNLKEQGDIILYADEVLHISGLGFDGRGAKSKAGAVALALFHFRYIGKRVMAAGQWLLTEPARRHKPQYAVRLFCR